MNPVAAAPRSSTTPPASSAPARYGTSARGAHELEDSFRTAARSSSAWTTPTAGTPRPAPRSPAPPHAYGRRPYARRPADGRPPPPPARRTGGPALLRLGPLTPGDAALLIRERAESAVAPAVREELITAAEGNPAAAGTAPASVTGPAERAARSAPTAGRRRGAGRRGR
ncbi:hypothetical protein ACFQV4_24975 [Streptomyces thermocarboxydus]